MERGIARIQKCGRMIIGAKINEAAEKIKENNNTI
jgi:hypothetical protein